jgi:hypothetical protein
MKAANYTELVCDPPRLICGDIIVDFWSFSGGGAMLSREVNLGLGWRVQQ